MFSPAGLLVVVLLFSTGCRTIGSVRGPADRPLVLTAAEAPRLQAQARARYEQQPRTVARVQGAAELLEQVGQALDTDYPAQWEAARAWMFVATYAPAAAARAAAARRAVVLARQARALDPDRVEGHYWYAIAVGLLADADRSYGLSAVGEMTAALDRAIELDERYDQAGPLRALGTLLLRAPGPPLSIGSPRRGLRLLEKAIDHFPEYPENYLYWAEALQVAGRDAEARQALGRLVALGPVADQQRESAEWRAAAAKLRQQWD
ncbi:hypothetical protein HQ590_12635 [bacterium]|nr:hypothetical protein [bacterium]